MTKLQKGDRVRAIPSGNPALVTNGCANWVHVIFSDGTTGSEHPESFRHVTESLTELAPVMGERLTLGGLEVLYLAVDQKESMYRHVVQMQNSMLAYTSIDRLSRPKRTKTVSRIVIFNQHSESYGVGEEVGFLKTAGWVKVAEFSHEVPND